MQAVRHLAGLIALVVFVCGVSWAQDAAETAAMTSKSAAAAAQSAKPPTLTVAIPSGSAGGTASGSAATGGALGSVGPHMLARTGPPMAEVNRKDFEGNAGPQAAKLLFRSTPSGAEIFINGRLVGRTPLLMLIAPGKYEIEMRGSREETGHRTVGVMPKETRSVLVTLHQKYPSAITTR